MNDRLKADPEGLRHSARAYNKVTSELDSLLDTINTTFSGYYGCWGDDSYGHEFAAKFLPSHQMLVAGVQAMRDQIDYAYQSVTKAGKAYGDAEDYATGQSTALFENNSDLAAGSEDRNPAEPADAVKRRSDLPLESVDETGSGEWVSDKMPDPPQNTWTARTDPAGSGLPTRPGYLTSSMLRRALVGEAGSETELRVDGVPIGDGYRVLTANEVPDGNVRLVTDYYESIIPLARGRDVTVGDPDDPESWQDFPVGDNELLFLVKDKPQAERVEVGDMDPDERTHVEFHPDGTSTAYRPVPIEDVAQ